jgi:secreted PhoX family phosphatase
MHRREWIYLGATLGGTAALTAILSRAPRGHSRGLSESGLEKSDGPLALPPGFRQTILSRSGTAMSDGLRTPDLPDGMACFQGPDGSYVLMRNHEIGRSPSRGAFPQGQPSLAFDRGQDGGVSRLVVDPKTLAVKRSNMVLTGTTLNCSGGPSPFGYLTCED